MRESNFAFPSQNRASVCITSALYDRRALDCTAILPLINSLTHLTYLTSTSPRIREILTMDGGLERLIRILKTTKVNDKRSGWKWTMAFQCVANVGVRGSETIRTRVVDAGMVPVIITVLDNFLKALNHVRLEKEHHHHQQQMLAAAQLLTQNTQMIQSPAPSIPMTTTSTTTTYVGNLENNAITSTNRFLPNVTTTYEIRSSDDARSDVASWGSVGDNDESSTITAGTSNATLSPSLRSTTTTTTTTHLNPANNTTTTITTITNPSNSSPSSTTSSSSSSSVLEIDVLYREEDILLSLQLLAYLSKYPHIRTIFHSAYPPHNVFSLVERFTHRLHPAEIQYWAGVIMRNACRKDEARGGVRQCAYMACGKWESYAREFAKCRRCRKAKYCSKACQSKAWSEGHRWWCMERHSHADTSATTDNTNNTNNNNNNSNNNNNNNNSNNSNNNNSNTNQNINNNNNNNNNNNGHSITFGQSTTDTNNTNGTNSTNSSSNDNNDATSLNSGSGSGSGSILVSLS